MTVRLAEPWFLALGAAVALAWLLTRRRRESIPFSSVRLLDLPEIHTLRQRLAWIPMALRLLWLGLLIVALAGPQVAEIASAQRGPGLALELVIDISGSMGAIDSAGPTGLVTRLDQVKAFLREFLAADPSGQRANDLVGLIAFSKSPRVVCPLTTDHAALVELLNSLAVDRQENRTNIGDALALAIDRLRQAPSGPRVVILCSDGAHNVETALPPGQAARMAEALGVRIHVVGVGSELASLQSRGEGRDEEALRAIAQIGAGAYVSASGESASGDIAARLTELEPGSAPIEGYRRWRDLYPEVLMAALIVWLFESVVRASWLRVIP